MNWKLWFLHAVCLGAVSAIIDAKYPVYLLVTGGVAGFLSYGWLMIVGRLLEK